MGRPINTTATRETVAPNSASPSFVGRCLRMLLQASLFLLILVWLWQLLGSEPQTEQQLWLQLLAIGLTQLLTAGLWSATSGWTLPRTVAFLALCAGATLLIEWDLARDFARCQQVLKPARIADGRILHEALGLSYAQLPGLEIAPQPTFKKSPWLNPGLRTALPSRLRVVDVLVFQHRMHRPPDSEAKRAPAMIVLEVQKKNVYHLKDLIQIVSNNEERTAASADIEITHHTHQVKFAGIDMVEYELFNHARRYLGRSVYFHHRQFLLNFMLLTDNESDRVQFDQLLESIRWEGP